MGGYVAGGGASGMGGGGNAGDQRGGHGVVGFADPGQPGGLVQSETSNKHSAGARSSGARGEKCLESGALLAAKTGDLIDLLHGGEPQSLDGTEAL